jgi:hypothetical protein
MSDPFPYNWATDSSEDLLIEHPKQEVRDEQGPIHQKTYHWHIEAVQQIDRFYRDEALEHCSEARPTPRWEDGHQGSSRKSRLEVRFWHELVV